MTPTEADALKLAIAKTETLYEAAATETDRRLQWLRTIGLKREIMQLIRQLR